VSDLRAIMALLLFKTFVGLPLEYLQSVSHKTVYSGIYVSLILYLPKTYSLKL
jgi:hypothetical protein